MPFVGFVVNKVHPSRPVTSPAKAVEEALAAHPGVAKLGLSGTSRTMAAQTLLAAHAEIETLAVADRRAVDQLRKAGGTTAVLVEVPLLRDDVHDVDRLVGLEQYLLGTPAPVSAAASSGASSSG
jgi:hypothetical protein